MVEEDVACDIVGEKADAGRYPDAGRRDKGVAGAMRVVLEVQESLGISLAAVATVWQKTRGLCFSPGLSDCKSHVTVTCGPISTLCIAYTCPLIFQHLLKPV